MIVRFRHIAIIAIIVISVYISSYTVLSINGVYTPGTWGLQSYQTYGGMAPKDWIWMPKGFMNDDDSIRQGMIIMYFPCYIFDRRFVHSEYWPTRGIHPIDERFEQYIE